jgi:aerobic C4-dicarboxylate transport protein
MKGKRVGEADASSPARQKGKGLLRQLWFQVLAATAAAIALGHFAPAAGVAMKPLGDVFIALVRMIIAPVIFVTVVHGVASMRDLRRAGRVAVKALIYFELVTTVALVFALVAVNLLRPGAGMHIDPAALDAGTVSQYAAQAEHRTVVEFILGIVPETLVGAFVQPNVLQVLFVSILFACGLVSAGEAGKPVLDLIARLATIVFRIVNIIMYAAPVGAFGAMAFTIGRFGAGALAQLGGLIGEFYLVCAVFTVIVFGAIAWAAGVSLLRLVGYIREEIVIVAATTSTETVLPRLIEKLERLGCERSVVGLVLPAGYSFNLDGTCLYLSTVVVFLAQATNTPLDIGEQISLMLVLLLTSKGAAGVAGAAFVVLAATIATTHAVPLAAMALILGIHRILAEALTFVNLVGNSLATIVVAKWEGAMNESTLRRLVGFRALARAV